MHVWVHSIKKVSTSVSPRMGPAHCVVVADACDSITAVLLVAAADRTPKWLSKLSMKEAGAPAM